MTSSTTASASNTNTAPHKNFDKDFDEDFVEGFAEDVFDGVPVGGKPLHGWTCDCPEECQRYLDAGLPRPGEEG